jgi:hypothetical protein
MDAAAGSLEKGAQEAIDGFWKKEDGKRAAMKAFREALVALTEPATQDDVAKAVEAGETLTEGQPTRKLVVVVDELDRCRPDYALSLLEIIKHFFNVDGVHFVLGCNMEALAESVRARYGAGYDGQRYLQKFVTLKLSLVGSSQYTRQPPKWEDYLQACAKEMGFSRTTRHLLSYTSVFLDSLRVLPVVSLRDVERQLTQLVCLPKILDGYSEAEAICVALLCVLKEYHPAQFRELTEKRSIKLDYSEIFDFGAAENSALAARIRRILHCFSSHPLTEEELDDDAVSHLLDWDDPEEYLFQICHREILHVQPVFD